MHLKMQQYYVVSLFIDRTVGAYISLHFKVHFHDDDQLRPTTI